MVYVTGDMHGDLARFRASELRKLKKNDYLIVCGDFGFLWDGSKKEKRILEWIGKRRYHVLFVEGIHDNYDLLNSYEKMEWNGGMARQIAGKLYHLCRGHVFHIDANTVFAFGGGESKDTDARSKGKTWWEEELPTQEELDTARKNLAKHKNSVDYIITHQSSRRLKKLLTMSDNEANVLDAFLDEVREKCSYKRWYCGSFHMDKSVPPGEIALFRSVVPMSEGQVLFNTRSKTAGVKKK